MSEKLSERLEALLARLDETTEGEFLERLANGRAIALQCMEFVRDHGPAIAAALRAVEGDAARNAYNTLHALTKPGTYGRECIQALRHLALGDESPEAKDHCPFCLSWLGGPLTCCDDWMTATTWEPITKSEAERRRPLPAAPLDAADGAEGVG